MHRTDVHPEKTYKTQGLKNKKTIATFVDFKKAYDSLDRQLVGRIMKNKGLDATHENW